MSFRPGYSILTRQAEWTMAIIMLGQALTISLSPQTVVLGGFHLLGTLGLTADILFLCFFLGGAMRAASLYANGHWPVVGPVLRVCCAVGGAVLWLQMAYSLIVWSHDSGYISMGVSVYIGIAIGEFISVYRAVQDGRSNSH